MNEAKSDIKNRWGGIDSTFVAIVSPFLENYTKLGLDSVDFTLVVHLMSFKWDDRNPFPSVATLANRMDLADRTIQNRVQKLERLGVVRRIPRDHDTNEFDLSGLFGQLKTIQVQAAKTAPAVGEDNASEMAADYAPLPGELDALNGQILGLLLKIDHPAFFLNRLDGDAREKRAIDAAVGEYPVESKLRALRTVKRQGLRKPELFAKAAEYVLMEQHGHEVVMNAAAN